ncbi:capsule biosynthesis protein [Pararobbsia silviterrae]|uniref:Capsular biosynthesis protein n=1 Tax=Pararobbsia silviterrae TaxID=1792498 RepID=A0A494XA90_9BURK|nr:capsular biosynthesis protein [Pararobbsia silviterrae]RKP47727.1 capsular biosynthesis protein [Pararobbsia silviterrae]
MAKQCFLFLQGPISTFFRKLGDALSAEGHRVVRVNLCAGDALLWRGRGAIAYRGSAARWPAFIEDLMDREQVTDLVLLAEQRPFHRVAIAAATKRNIRVTATDFGYLRPDWITLEPDGLSALSRFPRTPQAIHHLAQAVPAADLRAVFTDSFPKQAALEVTHAILSWLLAFRYPGFRSHQIHHPVLNYLATGWRLLMRGRRGAHADHEIAALKAGTHPWFVFPMQMEVDYSLRAYSTYPNGVAALETVIGSFARHAPADAVLVTKLHPLDPGVRRWHRIIARIAQTHGVADRVRFLDGGALDRLLDGARGVVTVNSTVGVWSIRAGIPTMALGAAIFDVRGLAWDGALDAFWRHATPPDPTLVDAFVRALAGTIQMRGVYYRDPGLTAAVKEAAKRLDADAQTRLRALLEPHAQLNAKAPHATIV